MEVTKLPDDKTIDFQLAYVGKYDSSVMPAATLWRGNCDSLPQRYFYNEKDDYPGEYDISDIAYRLDDYPDAVDSVTLRPGYKITLYSKSGFKGVS